MAEPTKPQPHIPWSNVIEPTLSNSLSNADGERFIQALTNIQNSVTGQRVFAELTSLQKLIPQNHHWQRIPTDNDKQNPKRMAGIEADNKIHASRDPHKLMIHLYQNNRPGGDPLTPDTSTHAYNSQVHSIYLGIPQILKFTLIKYDPQSQRKVLAPNSLEETLIHEMDHAVKNLREKYQTKLAVTKPCGEAMAVAAQQEYVEEVNSKSPEKKLALRKLYVDADEVLKLALSKAGYIHKGLHNLGLSHTTIWGIKSFGNSKERVLGYVENHAPSVVYDAGCTNLSDNQVLARTRKLLQDNGITNDQIPDSEMQQAIDNGLKKNKLGRYDSRVQRTF